MRQRSSPARSTKRLRSEKKLIRLLGLYGEQLNFRLPQRLPELPKQVIVARYRNGSTLPVNHSLR